MRFHIFGLILLVCVATAACEKAPPAPVSQIKMSGPLIASSMTMVAGWEFPKNPLTDKSLDSSKLSEEIRRGFKIFTNTPGEAARFTPGKMSCTSCHLNAGQREKMMPLVAVAGMFPEYNRRSGRIYTLTDRIIDCFIRSQNAVGVTTNPEELPMATSPEVLALAAYLTWIGKGYDVGQNPSWRGQNTIAADKLIPVAKLDTRRGEAIYMERCATCHGPDGQGVQIGDKRAGPLWGPDSWNDGAGAARVHTLAGMIRYSMPYLDPGNISDEDAQLVSAFINSKPRPVYPYKDRDYRTEKLPPDAVYYLRQASNGEGALR